MENPVQNRKDIIEEMIRQQLNDPGSIRMTDGTTFAYRFTLTPKEAVSLGLPPQTPQADILLDLMIPQISGMDVMQHIRRSSVVPVMILSARDTETDKTLGLSLGADDYITKPFSVAEVLARIRANLRRALQYDCPSPASAADPELLTAGKLVMNLSDYSLTKNGQPIELTAKEFEILKLLLQNPKRVYTKEQIYSLVWKDAYCGDENAVNVHISRLRSKIEDNPKTPRYILTVWGIGYKLGERL